MIICDGRHPFVVKERGGDHLEKGLLSRGELSFTEAKGFFSLGFMNAKEERFSEVAKQFCRQLVNPQALARPSAEAALQHRWLGANAPSPAFPARASGYPASPETQRAKGEHATIIL